jgi:hypothetical protein
MAALLRADPETFCGAVGTVKGVTATLFADASDVPIAFVAVALSV